MLGVPVERGTGRVCQNQAKRMAGLACNDECDPGRAGVALMETTAWGATLGRYPRSIRISVLSGSPSKTLRSDVTSPIFVSVGTELVSS